jgi:hypothetical protein
MARGEVTVSTEAKSAIVRCLRSVSPATATALVIGLLLAVPTGAEAQGVARAPAPQQQVAQALKTLKHETKSVPKRNLSKRNKLKLLTALKHVRKAAKKDPCGAVDLLDRYRKGLRKIHDRRLRGLQTTVGGFRGQLEADALELNTALMQLPKAHRCGGGDAALTSEAEASVLESDATHITYQVNLPPPTFTSHQVQNQQFEEMVMEGMGKTDAIGEPGLPIMTHNFAIPPDTGVTATVSDVSGYKLAGVNLCPTQEAPVDGPIADVPGAPDIGQFANPPFTIDSAAYHSGGQFPAQLSTAGPLGEIRDLNVGGVDFAGGTYTPKSDTLQVFTSFKVNVQYGDGSKPFGSGDNLDSPWETKFFNNYGATLDNFASIRSRIDVSRFQPVFCGEEMLVVTSSALRPAANTFAVGKNAQGIVTRVVEVGSGPGQIGTTPGEIQAFIRGHLNSQSCLMRPVYVVLFGNTAAVPTWIVPCSAGGNVADCNIASDLPYSLSNDSDLFADVELGRIPTPDPTNAAAVVTKILNYENTPPAPDGDDFYHHATVTSYFQPPLKCVLNEGASGTPDCDSATPNGHWEIDYPANTDTRGFTITAERIQNAMAAESYQVDRLYTTDDANVNPLNYWNGTPIPPHLRRPTFSWDANSTQFLDAYNQGRFLILHRDHGWPDGWAAPTLHSGHVPFMTNGTKLPVVFGINCASAAFDDPAHPSFVELQVTKPDGGAFAGFGDTRESPTWPNNHVALGFFDAFFPLTVSTYGSPDPTRRLGDVLVRGKQYMATQEGFEWQSSGGTFVEHYLYGLLGDPSAQMWAAEPMRFHPPQIDVHFVPFDFPKPGDPVFKVQVNLPLGAGEPPALGTVATLFHDGEAIGRATVGADGTAEIIPDTKTPTDDLTVTFDQQGALPASKEVSDVPTTLTVTPPGPNDPILVPGSPTATFTGHLDPAFAGGVIRVVYTPEKSGQGPAITHTVNTDASGNYSDTVTFTSRSQAGNWHVQAFFDGQNGYSPSQSASVAFEVVDNF